MNEAVRVFLPLLVLLATAIPGHVRARVLPYRTARYAVILVLDGARPDELQAAPMPNLHRLMQNGTTYKQAYVGQILANTPPSHATIGSGVFPKHHGIMGFWWKDPRNGQVTRPTDLAEVQAGALERVLTYNRVPSIAAAVKRRYPRAKSLAVSGHKCYAADAMGGPAADVILCSLVYHDRWVAQAMGLHRPPPGAVNNPHFDSSIPSPGSGIGADVEQWRVGQENRWTMNYVEWAVQAMRFPRVVMVNLPETDVLGHFVLKNRWVFRTLMATFDRELGQLIATYRRAGIFKRTDFIITADHGMDPVESRLPFRVLDQAIKQAGATKVYLEADTAAAIGIKESRKAHAVAVNVHRLGGPLIDATYYKVHRGGIWRYRPAYVRSDLPYYLRSAYAQLVDTSASPAGADVIVLYAPHVTTGDRPIHQFHWVGGHLGGDWDEQHIPLMLEGPGVRRGVTSSYPARLVDIAPTVEHLLGARSGRVDGHVLADALVHASSRLRAQQSARARHLGPEVAAIQARTSDRR